MSLFIFFYSSKGLRKTIFIGFWESASFKYGCVLTEFFYYAFLNWSLGILFSYGLKVEGYAKGDYDFLFIVCLPVPKPTPT